MHYETYMRTGGSIWELSGEEIPLPVIDFEFDDLFLFFTFELMTFFVLFFASQLCF